MPRGRTRRSSKACPIEVIIDEPGLGVQLLYCERIVGDHIDGHRAFRLLDKHDVTFKMVNSQFVSQVRMNKFYCTSR